MNTITLIGRLTRDPELRTLPSGTEVCTLRIAYDQSDPGQETGFVDVTCWQATAKAVSGYLIKGDEVGITGELRFSQWEQDDTKRSKLVVNARRIDFLRKVKDGRAAPNLHVEDEPRPIAA